MKNAGLILIFLSSLVFGFEMNRPGKQRIELLEKLCRSLELLHAEMSSRPGSIEALCSLLAADISGAAEFFGKITENMDKLGNQSFQEIWTTCIETKLSYLNSDDQYAMKSLGAVLGSYELSEQLASISACRNRLYNNLVELKAVYPANRKMYLGISCSVGAMLILVLI